MLGELPGVVALGEVVHLWQRGLREGDRCGCGTPFAGCGFWQAVGEIGFGGWHRVDPDRVLRLRRLVERIRHIPLLAAGRRRHLLAEYVDHYRRIYAAASALTGARLVVDSSKHSALAWCLSCSGPGSEPGSEPGSDLELRVAHVIRDPRGVAYSWTKRVRRPETGGRTEMTRYPPARSALLWDTHNALLGLLARRGVPVTQVRYERLLADPAGGLRALAGFAGLTPTPADLSFLSGDAVRLGPGHSAAGNPMRFATGTVPLRPDDVWRRDLPAGHRRLVAALCAPLLASYGYPVWSV